MKQVLQQLSDGETLLVDVPCPAAGNGEVLIKTSRTLVSPGTEKMLVDFGKANLIDKARQQPDKVKQVMDKVKTDGLFPTLKSVKNKLSQPIPLGYSNVGRVLESNTQGFSVGDRVVSNGHHAEFVAVPENLTAKIPDAVDDEDASFTVLGAIALQGIRLAQPTLGERVVVTGLGLIGLLAVQILKANGCKVLGIDMDASRCDLARIFGAETVDLSAGGDPLGTAAAWSEGQGVDSVIITASTKSNDPVHQAAQMCRKRGKIVLVGVTGLELQRSDFYEKELSFQVSCSYGPGRYDSSYEEDGHDYPLAFVRWTEKRNFEAVLGLMAEGKLDVKSLVTHRFPIAEAIQAYSGIGAKNSLGIILEYPSEDQEPCARSVILQAPREGASPVVGILGAGNFAGAVLLPALAKTGARLKVIVSKNGVSGTQLAKKFGVEVSSSDEADVLGDDEVDTVIISTRHHDHARQVLQALEKGKNVFVEKPLCLSREELGEIESAYQEANEKSGARIMVGFNRRFAPHVQTISSLLRSVKEPKAFVMTVNAGAIPSDHWVQDPAKGGGRIVGEACHFVDLLRYLAGAPIVNADAVYAGGSTGANRDIASIQLQFQDGSIGAIHYLSNGSKKFPKERLEVFSGGGVLQLNNFRSLEGYGWPGFRKSPSMKQDKGHNQEISAFISALKTGEANPIPPEEIFEVTRVTLDVAEQGQS